jgi:predicted site-specific integrase-resolvase
VKEIEVEIYPDGRLDVKNCAAYLGVKIRTLAEWRVAGTGPRFLKRMGRVFYYQTDIDEWLLLKGKKRCSSIYAV